MFFLTETLELGCAFFLWLMTQKIKLKVGNVNFKLQHFLLAVLAASALSHPFAWWFNEWAKGSLFGWWRVALIEFFVLVAEASFYRFILPLAWLPAMLLSLLCNATSLFVGLWLIRLF